MAYAEPVRNDENLCICFHDTDRGPALTLFMELAQIGVPDAQYYVGKFYFYGRLVEEDGGKAKTWLSKAAAKGHQGAAALLSKLNKK